MRWRLTQFIWGLRFTLGVMASTLLLLLGGEAFLHWFPPSDFRVYLAEESGLSGPYKPDSRLGARYASWASFEAEYSERMAQMQSELASRRTWALFGNSFVHMRGMLADTMRDTLPDRPVFNLGRNEPLFVRLAQIDLLLNRGFAPDRLYFVLLPHDCLPYTTHSLDQVRVAPEGGIAYAPRKPEWARSILDRSRLALLAWIRTGRQKAVPDFRPSSLNNYLPESVVSDFRRMLGELASLGRQHGVPITVVFIPNHEEITRGAGFAFQDTLGPICEDVGLDVCDVRAPFLAADDPASLFIPDKHFSPRGNRILLEAILAHPRPVETPVSLIPGGTRP